MKQAGNKDFIILVGPVFKSPGNDNAIGKTIDVWYITAEKMRMVVFILSILVFQISGIDGSSQEITGTEKDTFNLGGQVSLWTNFNYNNPLPFIAGARYIPALNYGVRLSGQKFIDFEASANIYGSFAFNPFDTSFADGNLKPYRFWARYSDNQFELRLGLQKINFGSASMLRPLMWFDQMDPRDPLQLTDGVWALLARYYFLNNASIWLWGLYGNHDPRAWEMIPTNKGIPEFGGRIQVPVPKGEIAVSYNHRMADNRDIPIFSDPSGKIPEDKFGFDARLDLETGIWLEGSWTRKRMDLGTLTNQEVLNAGADYTFGLGNGLYVAYEHLLLSYDQKAFELANRTMFSLLMINYPINLFDRVGGIIYYNWTNRKIYNFVSWQKQFDNIMLYLMGYWNPDYYELPAQSVSRNYFSGKGIQIMFVFNH